MRPALPRRLAAVALLLALPAAAQAQARTPPVTTAGFDFFRAALFVDGVRPFASINEFTTHGSTVDVILVILGDSPPGSDLDQLRRVHGPLTTEMLRGGGAVLVAANTPQPILLPSGGRVSIRGDPVTAPSPFAAHNGDVRCPYVVPRPARRSPDPVRDVFAGLGRLATRTPTSLWADQTASEYEARLTAAGLPVNSRHAFSGTRVNVDREPFALGGTGPDGWTRSGYRFLVLADHHVLGNEFIATEPDNLEFARRLARFLHDPDGANRTRCAFFENGRLVTTFNSAWLAVRPPEKPIPMPSLGPLQEKIVDVGNQLIDRLEEKNALNQMLLGDTSAGQNRTLRNILRGLAVVGAVWAVWFLLRRVWKARQPTDQPRPPTPTGGPPPSGPTGIFGRREQELLRRNNLYEPARDLIRQVFAEAGAPPDAGPKPPPVHFEKSARKPALLRNAIDELWRVGYGRPAVVTVRRWEELGPQLEMVRAWLAAGAWRFAAGAATRGGSG